jgi:hypothetical protein
MAFQIFRATFATVAILTFTSFPAVAQSATPPVELEVSRFGRSCKLTDGKKCRETFEAIAKEYCTGLGYRSGTPISIGQPDANSWVLNWISCRV